MRHLSPTEPCFERLEPRLMLAAISWDGGAGTLNWHDAENWSTDAVPGIDDDVTIDVAGSPTIQFGVHAGSRAVRSLVTRNDLLMWGGTFTVATAVLVENHALVRLTGVTLNGGHWSAVPGVGSLEVASNSTMLLGVTITGELQFNASGSSATLGEGTTFQVARLVGANSSIRFTPGQTVTGDILFDGNTTGDRSVRMVGNGTLTIGPTGRITATSRLAGTARVGVPSDSAGVMTLVNHGTIISEAGRTIHIQPEQLTSTGTLRATSTGWLRIEPTGSWTSSGQIISEGAGSSVTLMGAWSNTGSISITNGRLNFGGTYTTAGMNLSQFTRVGGTVSIGGILDNSGSTLTLNAATGSWEMNQGTISGGSVEITGAVRLTVGIVGESLLSGTSVSGDFVVGPYGRVTLDAGATVETARLLDLNSSIGFTPGQVLTGTILFDGPPGDRSVDMKGTAGTLTIGPTGRIRTSPTFAGTGYIGRSGNSWPMTLVNEGEIAAAAPSGTVRIWAHSLTTTGTLRASAGTLQIAPLTAWSNAGMIVVESGTLSLGSTFITAGGIGAWSRSGGAVDVTGTLNNTGAVTTLNASTGSWKVSGTITGGTMNLVNGQVLTMGTIAVLSAVTVNGELLLDNSFSGVTISGGTTFTTARLIANEVAMRFAPGQTLTGTIVFQGSSPGNRTVQLSVANPGTLTIGPTGQIVTGPDFAGLGRIGSAGPAMTLINAGSIRSDVSGRTVRVNPAAFTNTPGGVGTASGGGILEVGGTFTNAGLLSGVTGLVAIIGTLNNEGSTQTLNAATGSWNLKGGTISGGVIQCTDDQILICSSGTLSGVVVNGELSLPSIAASVMITGGTTFTLARLRGNNSSLSFASGQTVTGTILLEGEATGNRSLYIGGTGGTMTIGPTGQVRTTAGFAGSARIASLSSVTTLRNEGLISSEVIGRTLTIQSTSFTNIGTLQALNGGTLAISPQMWTSSGAILSEGSTLTLTGAWSSTGTISVPGSTVTLGGTFSTSGLNAPQFIGTGATVRLTGTMNNAGSTLTLDGGTGAWVLQGGTINGGAIALSGGQVLTVVSPQSTLSGVAVGGNIMLTSNVLLIVGAGTAFQTARLAASGASLIFAPGHVLTGTILFENGAGTRVVSMNPAGTFTIAPTGRILTAPGFSGSATVGAAGMTIINQGVIGAETPGGTVRVQPGSLTNVGTLRAIDGGVLNINAGTTTNFNAGVLTAGEWFVGAGSTMTATFGNILTNSADITLVGSALWARAATIAANVGTLRLLGGRGHNVAGPFTNSGTLALSPGSLLTVGSFTQTASAQLELQISGSDPLTQAGRIAASDAASLDGRLAIVAVNGYVPAQPVTFQLLVAASVIGSFEQLTMPAIAPNLRASIIYDPTGVSWRVTSIADIDGDGIVTSADISAFITTWLQSLQNGTLIGDFNGDGVVDSSDISAFITAWLESL